MSLYQSIIQNLYITSYMGLMEVHNTVICITERKG